MYPLSQGRWWKWLNDGRLCCADSHHLPRVFSIDESGCIRCNKWIEKEKRECSKWLWIMHFKGGGNIIVDVSLEDIKRLNNMDTATQRIAYLGIFGAADAEAV